jgi:hypothetical protein
VRALTADRRMVPALEPATSRHLKFPSFRINPLQAGQIAALMLNDFTPVDIR